MKLTDLAALKTVAVAMTERTVSHLFHVKRTLVILFIHLHIRLINVSKNPKGYSA